MLKLFLWLKYLRRRRIILLSIAAVALSVSLLVVVASLFNGFIAALEQNAVEMIGDIVVSAPPGAQIRKYPAFIERLEQTGTVEAATATLASQGLLHVGRGNVLPVNIWGIEPDRRARVTEFRKVLVRQANGNGRPSFEVPGGPGKLGGFVGIGVVAHPDEKTDQYDREAIVAEVIGQQVFATTGTMDAEGGSEAVPKRRSIPFYIADLIYTGVHDLDSGFVFLPIDVLQKELYPGRDGALATSINIKLRAGVDPEAAVTQIRGLWDVFATQELGWDKFRIFQTQIDTARHMQSQYVAAIRQQMGVLLLVFGVISFSVVVLVFCIFYMMVKLKQRDVAVVKSCGATNLSIVGLFLGFGVSVGVVGSGIGAVLGYVITHNINQIEHWIRAAFGLKLWQSSVYMFDKIPNQVDWGAALPIVALAVAAAALGALLPAVVAARTRPVEVLRYE